MVGDVLYKLYQHYAYMRSLRILAELHDESETRISELKNAESSAFLEVNEKLDKYMSHFQRKKVVHLTLYFGWKIDYELTAHDWTSFEYVFLAPKKERSDVDRIIVDVTGSVLNHG
jgi:hypothetical protein